MPTNEGIRHKEYPEPWYDVKGDQLSAKVPGRNVWNTYASATGTSVAVPAGVSTKILNARAARRGVVISHSSPTGTVHFWLAYGQDAVLYSGLGPLTQFGANVQMDGVLGIYTGPVYAIHDGVGTATLAIEEMW